MRSPTAAGVSLFLAITILAFLSNCSGATAKVKGDNPPLLLVISFDGFKPDYLSLGNVSMNNLLRIAKEGVSAPSGMIPCFSSKTLPNHFSIATGLYEESHGIIDNEMYNSKKQPNHFRKTQVAPDWWDNGLSMPVWTLNEKKGHSSATIMWAGGGNYYQGTNTRYTILYNDSMLWTSKVDMALDYMTADIAPANCVFLYFNEPDQTSHRYGPFSNKVFAQLDKINNITGYLLDKIETLKIHSKLNLMIVSDHGMTTVPKGNQIQISDIVPPDLCSVYGTGPVVGVKPIEGKFNQVYDFISKSSLKYNFTVFKKEEIPKAFHYKDSDNVLPIVLIAALGYQFISYNDSEPAPYIGTHGYNNTLPSMRALFLARGPAFKKNLEVQPFLNVNLYSLMCHILKVEPGPNNGTFEALSFILSSDDSKTVKNSVIVDRIGLEVSAMILGVILVIGIVSVIFIVRKKVKMYQYDLIRSKSNISVVGKIDGMVAAENKESFEDVPVNSTKETSSLL